MAYINGKNVDCKNMKLSEFLEKENFDISTIAIEFNNEILPKSQYEKTYISESDKIEIVCFVGGG